MNIDQIKNAIEDIKKVDLWEDAYECDPLQSYYVKEKWFSDGIPGGSNNGVYFYTDLQGKILYIGKAEYSNKRGINFRVCGHLKKLTKNSDIIFNNHQWMNSNDKRVTGKLKKMIQTGRFLIWTLPIRPSYFVSLFEVYFQTMCKKIDGKLPPLNNQIG